MARFKVGDRVRTIGNYTFDPTVGIIETLSGDNFRVRVELGSNARWVNEKTWLYLPNELELITEGGAPVARRTFKLIKDTPTLAKGAILQEACDDGTQEYVVLNHEEAVKDRPRGVDVRYASAIYNRSLVEDQPKWFVEVFQVEPQYMTREELDQWEAFKAAKPAKKSLKKSPASDPLQEAQKRVLREWSEARRKAQSAKLKAYWAAKRAA